MNKTFTDPTTVFLWAATVIFIPFVPIFTFLLSKGGERVVILGMFAARNGIAVPASLLIGVLGLLTPGIDVPMP